MFTRDAAVGGSLGNTLAFYGTTVGLLCFASTWLCPRRCRGSSPSDVTPNGISTGFGAWLAESRSRAPPRRIAPPHLARRKQQVFA